MWVWLGAWRGNFKNTPRKTMLDPTWQHKKRHLEKSLFGDVITIGGQTWSTLSRCWLSKEMQENDIIVDSRRLPDCLNKSVKKVSFIENSETVQPLQYTTMKEHLVYSKWISHHQKTATSRGNIRQPWETMGNLCLPGLIGSLLCRFLAQRAKGLEDVGGLIFLKSKKGSHERPTFPYGKNS